MESTKDPYSKETKISFINPIEDINGERIKSISISIVFSDLIQLFYDLKTKSFINFGPIVINKMNIAGVTSGRGPHVTNSVVSCVSYMDRQLNDVGRLKAYDFFCEKGNLFGFKYE